MRQICRVKNERALLKRKSYNYLRAASSMPGRINEKRIANVRTDEANKTRGTGRGKYVPYLNITPGE